MRFLPRFFAVCLLAISAGHLGRLHLVTSSADGRSSCAQRHEQLTRAEREAAATRNDAKARLDAAGREVY